MGTWRTVLYLIGGTMAKKKASKKKKSVSKKKKKRKLIKIYDDYDKCDVCDATLEVGPLYEAHGYKKTRHGCPESFG